MAVVGQFGVLRSNLKTRSIGMNLAGLQSPSEKVPEGRNVSRYDLFFYDLSPVYGLHLNMWLLLEPGSVFVARSINISPLRGFFRQIIQGWEKLQSDRRYPTRVVSWIACFRRTRSYSRLRPPFFSILLLREVPL